MLRRWKLVLAGAVGLALGGNALFMLGAPFAWFEAVPGVVRTGPFNDHFVRDVGAAYLMSALALAAFVWSPRRAWPAVLAAAGVLTAHASIHLFDALCGRSSLAELVGDLPGVFLPAILAVVLGLRATAREA